jgi:very-short-patch-repair endonuclease
MNRWDAIRYFYNQCSERILAAPANEWAIDPYAWEPFLQMTPIEAWLWGDIREANAVMYPQWPVGGFFVDFANPVAKVAIECDGAAYHTDKEKDAARDASLERLGWAVYRITGGGCRTDSDEESGEPGYARQFIEIVAKCHGLKRSPPIRGVQGFEACMPLIDHLVEMNQ